VSELRIRSDSFVDQPLIDSFVPPESKAATTQAGDLAPLAAAAGAALSKMLGMRVQLVPANEAEAEEIEGRGGAKLAALLLTLRLGGTAARSGGAVAEAAGNGDVLAAYQARLLEAVMAAVADPELWPRGLDSLAVTVLAGEIEDGLWLRPSAMRALPERLAEGPHPRMVAGLGTVPMRLAVELAAGEISLLALLPLRIGQTIPIAPAADMALRMDGQPIGRVSLSSRPDGRQEALLVALDVKNDVEKREDRP
jgi:flagellar motor switch/type III secretory pathway protein FliN